LSRGVRIYGLYLPPTLGRALDVTLVVKLVFEGSNYATVHYGTHTRIDMGASRLFLLSLAFALH
jgi:hypothetical protein